MRQKTLSDGNCFYDALADQVDLHGIPGLESNHLVAKKFTFSRRTFYCFRDEWLHLFKADDEEDAKDKEDLPEQIQKFSGVTRSYEI